MALLAWNTAVYMFYNIATDFTDVLYGRNFFITLSTGVKWGSQHSEKKMTPSWFPGISTIDLHRFRSRSKFFDELFEFELFSGREGRTIRRSKSSSLEPLPSFLDRFPGLWRNCLDPKLLRSSKSRWESDRDLRRSQFRLQVVKTPKRVFRIVRIGNRCRCCCCCCCCCEADLPISANVLWNLKFALVRVFFCSTALTSTGWVRSTIKLCTVHWLSSARCR